MQDDDDHIQVQPLYGISQQRTTDVLALAVGHRSGFFVSVGSSASKLMEKVLLSSSSSSALPLPSSNFSDQDQAILQAQRRPRRRPRRTRKIELVHMPSPLVGMGLVPVPIPVPASTSGLKPNTLQSTKGLVVTLDQDGTLTSYPVPRLPNPENDDLLYRQDKDVEKDDPATTAYTGWSQLPSVPVTKETAEVVKRPSMLPFEACTTLKPLSAVDSYITQPTKVDSKDNSLTGIEPEDLTAATSLEFFDDQDQDGRTPSLQPSPSLVSSTPSLVADAWSIPFLEDEKKTDDDSTVQDEETTVFIASVDDDNEDRGVALDEEVTSSSHQSEIEPLLRLSYNSAMNSPEREELQLTIKDVESPRSVAGLGGPQPGGFPQGYATPLLLDEASLLDPPARTNRGNAIVVKDSPHTNTMGVPGSADSQHRSSLFESSSLSMRPPPRYRRNNEMGRSLAASIRTVDTTDDVMDNDGFGDKRWGPISEDGSVDPLEPLQDYDGDDDDDDTGDDERTGGSR